ncbi:hypothetical protein ACJQWK_03637 [Exserohilum turcicum]|uniref:Uncharacterized protein n=1 Tax=Exserohilum turcicum (strain 28A) TaxID=671987 RepID=R0KT49_EXST2|nr:uncharacterized protein SETTUDRAFT_40958 [Exserohilum turcica Et28A]EOA92114.1 hypothetical protein SETTUDRAFT_40958 [Exserohilum turcica Et28A]
MPEAKRGDGPKSHGLARDKVEIWRENIKDLRNTPVFLIEKWPCMYCHHEIEIGGLKDCAWFRCQQEACVGRGKLQVTCFWDVKGEREWVD